MKYILISLVSFTLSLNSAISQDIRVDVKTFGNMVSDEVKYYSIASSDTTIDENYDPLFRYYADFIHASLFKKGYSFMDPRSEDYDPRLIEYVVVINYSKDDPFVTSHNTSALSYAITGYDSKTDINIQQNFNNNYSISSETTKRPNYGYKSETRTVDKMNNLYNLTISCYKMVGYNAENIWNTYIVGVSGNGDMQYIYPYLVGSAIDHLGVETGYVRTYNIDYNDPEIEQWRERVMNIKNQRGY